MTRLYVSFKEYTITIVIACLLSCSVGVFGGAMIAKRIISDWAIKTGHAQIVDGKIKWKEMENGQ